MQARARVPSCLTLVNIESRDAACLDAIDEINEGTTHPFEHVSRLILSMTKRFPNTRLRRPDNSGPAFVILRDLVALHIFHARPATHSFGAPDISTVRSAL